MTDRKYEIIEHTADMGLRLYGNDLEELFGNGFQGLLEQVAEEMLDGFSGNDIKKIKLEAPDKEALLVDFLNELLYLINVEKWMPVKIKELHISNNRLIAEFNGGKFGFHDIIKTEIKAATYLNIEIKKIGDIWVTDVFFDV